MEEIKRKILGVGLNDIIPEHVMFGLGNNHPGITMIGYTRLTNFENCIKDVVKAQVKGDVIETGVWKGGAVIFARYLLNKIDPSRKVFVADSFCGLPAPDAEKYPADKDDPHHKYNHLRISEEQVRSNFKEFVPDYNSNTIFLKGWFKDTLPLAYTKFAVIRLDGDMYESTWDALTNLYCRLSVGGYVIIDDYCMPGCSKAVQDYRAMHGITEEIHTIDWAGCYWQKKKEIHKEELWSTYYYFSKQVSDINEHLEVLYSLAKECSNVIEFGTRSAVSTVALLLGCDNLISYDILNCNVSPLENASKKYNLNYKFIQADVLSIDTVKTEMLFIDTFHTYSQLLNELNLHAKGVSKYIVLHDTTTFGYKDEHMQGGYKVNPMSLKGAGGLKKAIEEFLLSEEGVLWFIYKEFTNNNGLTILKRKS